jgi:hypothetical protein
MVRKNAAWVGTLAFVTGAARVAAAQAPAEPPPPAPAPAPAPARAAPESEGASDHDRVVGRIGLSYFDVTNLPIAQPGGLDIIPGTVAAPVVGVRYWMQRSLGLDLGLGVGWETGANSRKNNGTNVAVADPSFPFGIALHFGLPLLVAGGQHYAFLVIPETTFGYATETLKGMGGQPDVNFNGVLLNLGARAGAEIYFGFIGIPQLALTGSFGVLFSYQQISGSSGSGTMQNSASQSTGSFATTIGSSPWSIFTNSISATYYL